jgi:inosine-uridine nucleoside N-ribohydrolase
MTSRRAAKEIGPKAPAAPNEGLGEGAAEQAEPLRIVPANRRVPVVLDTDIGDDIDDTWALAMLLKSPEVDIRLVVSDTGDTVYRAKLIARMLEIAGRTDVPVGVGIPGRKPSYDEPQRAWVKDYDLEDYPGRIYSDGVEAIIDTLNSSPEPVTLICIGPVTNIAGVLRRDPGVARKAHFVGMHGSINRGYEGKAQPDAEWNVKQDPKSCQVVFAGDWLSRTITPIDTCELARLTGEDYARLLDSDDPVLHAVLENYRLWSTVWMKTERCPTESSVLFDTVAVHLAYSREFLKMESMSLSVTDDGFTVTDPAGAEFDVAADWVDLDGYHAYLSRRLLAMVVR